MDSPELASIDSSEAKSRRRVLLVSYTFPPVGGAGVQRVTKFAKFLPRCGWDVSVLTTENPSVPLFDRSLVENLAAGTVVCRARTLEPGYSLKASLTGAPASREKSAWTFLLSLVKSVLRSAANVVLQPDMQILWKHNAVRVGMQRLAEVPHDVILASAPPFSTFLIAREISRRSGLPLIADYRDEWGISNQYWENKQLGRFSRSVQRRMQYKVLRAARAVIGTTQASADSLRQECRIAGSAARVECIYNGYDPDDFLEASAVSCVMRTDTRVRLAYVGTLWRLTSVEPIVAAFRRLQETSPGLCDQLSLVIVGRRTPAEQSLLDELRRANVNIEECDYLDHADAIRVMTSADALCVTLADLPGAGRVVPAKVFEYLAVGRPILAVAPRGELWSLLGECTLSRVYAPSDIAGIAEYLGSLACSRKSDARELMNGACSIMGRNYRAKFDRAHQARQLAEILDSAVVRSR